MPIAKFTPHKPARAAHSTARSMMASSTSVVTDAAKTLPSDLNGRSEIQQLTVAKGTREVTEKLGRYAGGVEPAPDLGWTSAASITDRVAAVSARFAPLDRYLTSDDAIELLTAAFGAERVGAIEWTATLPNGSTVLEGDWTQWRRSLGGGSGQPTSLDDKVAWRALLQASYDISNHRMNEAGFAFDFILPYALGHLTPADTVKPVPPGLRVPVNARMPGELLGGGYESAHGVVGTDRGFAQDRFGSNRWRMDAQLVLRVLDEDGDGYVTSEEFNEAKAFKEGGVLFRAIGTCNLGPNENVYLNLPIETLPRAMFAVREGMLAFDASTSARFEALRPLAATEVSQLRAQLMERSSGNSLLSDYRTDREVLLRNRIAVNPGGGVFVWDPATATHTPIGIGPFASNGNYGALGASLGSRVVIQGDRSPALGLVDVAAKTVTTLPPPPIPVVRPALAEVGGRLWLVGGYAYQNETYPAGKAVLKIQEWDDERKCWSVVGDLPQVVDAWSSSVQEVGSRRILMSRNLMAYSAVVGQYELVSPPMISRS